jgi:hypothetical protein
MWVSGATTAVLAGNWKPQILVAGLWLAGTLLLGAVVIALASRWRRRASDYRVPPDAQMAHFRSLYDKGEISAEEFERLRNAVLGTGQPRGGTTASSRSGSQAAKPGADGPPANGTPPDGVRPA